MPDSTLAVYIAGKVSVVDVIRAAPVEQCGELAFDPVERFPWSARSVAWSAT